MTSTDMPTATVTIRTDEEAARILSYDIAAREKSRSDLPGWVVQLWVPIDAWVVRVLSAPRN